MDETLGLRRTIDTNSFGAFRVLLALLVMWQHYEKVAVGNNGNSLDGSLQLGSCAVLVFFVLSGYVILSAVTNFYDGRPRAFITNRAWRIIPVYIISILLCAIVLQICYTSDSFLAYTKSIGEEHRIARSPAAPMNVLKNAVWIIPGANEIVKPSFVLVSIAWAVKVEILFYLVVAVCLWAYPRLGIRPAALFASTGAMLLVGMAAKTLLSIDSFPALSFAPYFVLGASFFFIRATRSRVAIGFAVAASTLMGAEILSHPEINPTLGFRQNLVGQVLLVATLIAVFVYLIVKRSDRPKN